MCSRTDETVNHIVHEFYKLSQTELKERHNWIEKRVLWKLFETNGIHVKSIWYEHQLKMVIKNK